MIDVENVPGPAVLPGRADADKRMLQALVVSSAVPDRRRRHRLTVVAAIAGLGLSGATAAAAYLILTPQRASDRSSARCYGTVSTKTGDAFPGTTVSVAAAEGQPAADTPPLALEACRDLWRRGFLTSKGFAAPDVANGPDGLPPADKTVPPLVACVLQTGQAAIYPGTAEVCAGLGLPLLAEG